MPVAAGRRQGRGRLASAEPRGRRASAAATATALTATCATRQPEAVPSARAVLDDLRRSSPPAPLRRASRCGKPATITLPPTGRGARLRALSTRSIAWRCAHAGGRRARPRARHLDRRPGDGWSSSGVATRRRLHPGHRPGRVGNVLRRAGFAAVTARRSASTTPTSRCGSPTSAATSLARHVTPQGVVELVSRRGDGAGGTSTRARLLRRPYSPTPTSAASCQCSTSGPRPAS